MATIKKRPHGNNLTVGQLKAHLKGLPEDTPIFLDIKAGVLVKETFYNASFNAPPELLKVEEDSEGVSQVTLTYIGRGKIHEY